MVADCEQVWNEISNYVDGDVAPDLRAAMDEHFRICKRCTAVLEGTINIVRLYGDERMFPVPAGFSYRLYRRLEGNVLQTRRTFFGWMVAAAAALVVAGGFELAESVSFQPGLRSEHARRGKGVPPDLMVLIYPDGKTFHATGCPYIHDKTNLTSVRAEEAMREGYGPCTRCMQKYL